MFIHCQEPQRSDCEQQQGSWWFQPRQAGPFPIRCHTESSPLWLVRVLPWPRSFAGHLTEMGFRDQEILIKSHL